MICVSHHESVLEKANLVLSGEDTGQMNFN